MLYKETYIRVDKIIIHEDFKDSVYDIALLKLGKRGLSGDPLYNTQLTNNSQKREWICQSSALPVFLTTMRQSLLVRKGTFMVSSTTCNDKVSPFLSFTLPSS